MAAETASLCEDYPVPTGNRRVSLITLTGPAAYDVVVPGSPPTGGQAIQASMFGLKWLEMVVCSLSDTGSHTAVWTPATDGKKPVADGVLMWVDAATWLEVLTQADLSAKVLRLMAWGR